MKIAIALASQSSGTSGVQRHALNLARCFLTRGEVAAVHLIIAPWQTELIQRSGLDSDRRLQIHVGNMRQSSYSRNTWHYRQLPLITNALGVDVVHLSYPVPLPPRAYSAATIVSLHDLYPYDVPSNFGFPKMLFNRAILRQCLRNVDAIACVSDSTYYRLVLYAPERTTQKATRIYNCVMPESRQAADCPLPGWKGEPFLLCVAQHRRNKNLIFLLNVLRRLVESGAMGSTPRLVIVGIGGPETRHILRTISSLGLTEHVLLLHGLSEEDLQWCYHHCEAVVAPSTIEGFGLPVAEALLAGCRVICSEIPAFREVAGDNCRFVRLDRNGEAAFADAIVTSLRQQASSPITLPKLTASVIAGQYMLLYRKLQVSLMSRPGLAASSNASINAFDK
jgi:glycosyltransferase involved in cell wall biosynthesis